MWASKQAVARGLKDPSNRVIQNHFAVEGNLGEIAAKVRFKSNFCNQTSQNLVDNKFVFYPLHVSHIRECSSHN